MSVKQILKVTLRWVLYIIGILLFLVVTICLLLQTDWGQRILKDRAVAYLQKQLHTKVTIGQLKTNWLHHLQLRQVYLEDPQKKVLLSVGSLDLEYDIFKIFSKSVDVSNISIDSAQVNLYRARADSNFNFNFIIQAFTSKPAAGGEKTSTNRPGYRFNLGTISLRRVVFSMKDEYGGQDFSVNAGSLQSGFSDFDLDKMDIRLKYLFTDSINTAITFSSPYKKEAPPSTSTSTPLHLRADTVRIQQAAFSFKNPESELSIETHAGLLAVSNIFADLAKMNFTLNRLQLIDHSTSVVIRSVAKNSTAVTAQKDSSKALTFFAGSIMLGKNQFDFVDKAKKPAGPKTIDFANLGLTEIAIRADSVGYDGTTYFANLHQLSAVEKSGFRLKQLSSNVRYSDKGVLLKKLILQTNANQLEADAAISYKSVGTITSDPSRTRISAVIKNGRLVLDELLYFQPALRDNASIHALLGKTFYLNTNIDGTLDKLKIPSLTLRESNTYLEASADIYNLPDIKKLLVDLRLKEFTGSRKELLALLPANSIPDSLLHYIPENFSVKGTYKGTPKDFSADIQLKSSEGDIAVKGTLKDITDKKKAQYDIVVSTNKLNLNKLLEDTAFGLVSAHIKAKGKGYDLNTADAIYDVNLSEGGYRNYRYHDITLNGNIAAGKIKAHIRSSDQNLSLTSDTEYDLAKLNGSFKTDTHISNIDLFKLHFAGDTLTVHGDINANFPVLDTAQFSGDLLVSNISILAGGRKYNIDSIKLNAVHASDTQTVQLTTPFLDATLKGQYTLLTLPAAIKTISNRYIYTNSKDTNYTKRVVAELNAKVRLPDSIMSLIPGLKFIDPFTVKATINTDSSKLSFGTTIIRKLVYNDYEIDFISIGAKNHTFSKNYNTLGYDVGFKSLKSPSLNLAESRTIGTINHGIIDGRIELLDEDSTLNYRVAYTITNDSISPNLKIGDSLIIDRKLWAVNERNIIYFNSRALKGTNLRISRDDQSIAILADSVVASGLPLNLRITKFELRNISDIIISDSSLVGGIANGLLTVENFDPFTFTTDLSVDSLQIKEINSGQLTAKVARQSTDKLTVDVALKGLRNDLTLLGDYNTIDRRADLRLNLPRFDLQNVEPFVQKYLSKLIGSIKGDLTIKGDLSKPEIRGELKTDSVEAIYRAYGTTIKIPTANLNFNEEGVAFKDFNFTDSAGNKGSLTGMIYTSDYRNFRFDLSMTTENFQVIGSRKIPEQNIYGPSYVDALLTVKGGGEKVLMVEGSVKVKDNSVFNYVYSSEYSSDQGNGIIEFFDPSHPEDTLRFRKKAGSNNSLFGVNMYLNVTPKTTVTIMLDELSGDNLKINGAASLNYSLGTDGQSSLNGNFDVESGYYELSIAQLIRKKFTIEKGSTIVWTGDPLKADVNLSAIYKVRTSTGELLSDMSSLPAGADKQKFDFNVYLILKEKLLKPAISFKIDMPPEQQDAYDGLVYARIRQINNTPAELNKQVMGLLALNHFIAENPFNSLAGGGTGFETQAYATAGKLLTQELTEMVGGYVKGVDITFDLNVDDNYSSGEAQRNTDLKVGVSKSLADNRLSVYVGSTFALEGHNQNANALSGLAGDITLEYLLTKDGKYRLKGYRLDENEVTFEGSVVKTGVTFVVVLEFNRVKNAFKQKKDK